MSLASCWGMIPGPQVQVWMSMEALVGSWGGGAVLIRGWVDVGDAWMIGSGSAVGTHT